MSNKRKANHDGNEANLNKINLLNDVPSQKKPSYNQLIDILTQDYLINSYSIILTFTYTYSNTYPIYLPFPDMDTSSSTSRKNVRAALSEQYDARVAETIEKVDPNRAKANEALKDVDNMEAGGLQGAAPRRLHELHGLPSPDLEGIDARQHR